MNKNEHFCVLSEIWERTWRTVFIRYILTIRGMWLSCYQQTFLWMERFRFTNEQGKEVGGGASAPGPNGVPYCVYKGVSDVLKYQWKLMVIIWKKGTILRKWLLCIFIPNENTIGQFQPFSLLHLEGKIFFCVDSKEVGLLFEGKWLDRHFCTESIVAFDLASNSGSKDRR